MLLKTTASIQRWIERSILTDDAQLLDLIIRIAAIAYLLDDVIEYRIFVRDLRPFFPSPILPAVSLLPIWTDWLFSCLHIVGLVYLIRRPRLWPVAVLILSISAIRVLGDLQRFKPWIMMYGLTILTAALPKMRAEARLQALRLMVVGLYFWAGFNKINTSFYLQVFPWFINPYWTYPKTWPILNLIIACISFTVPFFESSIGVLLLFRKMRKLATLMALIMLIVVLACLGPLGHNSAIAVWPWNAYLFITEMCLFLAPHPPCLQDIRDNWLAQLAAGVFIIAPVLGIWGLWHSDPSFKLYAGNEDKAMIIVDSREKPEIWPVEFTVAMIPHHEKNTSSDHSNEDDKIVFMLSTPYPNEYVFKTSFKALCAYLKYPAAAIVRTMRPNQFDSLHMTEKEEPLCPSKGQ